MQVGDLVKNKSPKRPRLGLVVEIPPQDDYWGDTAIVEWLCGFREELTQDMVEVVCK